MAKIKSSFECLICEESLNFPNSVEIADFVVLLIQFYKAHQVCERLEKKKTNVKKIATNNKEIKS